MTGPGPNSRRYRMTLALAGAALLWERLWPRLWPATAVVGAFAAVALLDLLPLLPGGPHTLILVAFAAALAAALGYATRGFTPIDRASARRRLERDSGFQHRPLSALEDRLAAGVDDPAARSLWEAHVRRMAGAARDLSVRLPAPSVPRREPWGIRAGVLLLLTIGVAAAGDEAGVRLGRALTPGFALTASVPRTVEVWIAPPTYTGVAPLFLNGTDGRDAAQAASAEAARPAVVEVPQGSKVLARVSGLGAPPTLLIGDRASAFAALGDGNGPTGFTAEAVIEDGDRLSIRAAGGELAGWAMRVVPDRPPTIGFAEPPGVAGNGLLRIAYDASDDYGVSDVVLRIQAGESVPGVGENAEVRLPLPLPALNAKSAASGGLQDLTAHPWAGQPVSLRLEAKDVAGQIGSSPPVHATLPEREFYDPVAKELIAERKRLNDDSTSARRSVAEALGRIAEEPERFSNDAVVSLALGVAKARLVHDRSTDAVASVQGLLWETALRLEQGDVPLAERRVQEAEQRLQEALSANRDPREIERLMDELKQALDRYLAAIASELARRGDTPTPLAANAQTLRLGDLKDLIEMARELARLGSMDSAQQVLSELRRMLDGVRAGLGARGMHKDLVEAQQMLQSLRNLGERQQHLLDRTFEQTQARRALEDRGERGGRTSSESEAGAAQQRGLRRELGELMLRLDGLLGGIPAPLTDADRAMRGAADALGQSRLGDAIPEQSIAVDALHRAIDAMGQAMTRRLGGLLGVAGGQVQGWGERSGDPFGRATGEGHGGFGIGHVDIPNQIEIRRAQEILQELRRRAGERDRPAGELDYIERLLRRF